MRLVLALALLSLPSVADAAAVTATAGATILEPARVPAFALADAKAEADGQRIRQVNAVDIERGVAPQPPRRTWPVVVEFE